VFLPLCKRCATLAEVVEEVLHLVATDEANDGANTGR